MANAALVRYYALLLSNKRIDPKKIPKDLLPDVQALLHNNMHPNRAIPQFFCDITAENTTDSTESRCGAIAIPEQVVHLMEEDIHSIFGKLEFAVQLDMKGLFASLLKDGDPDPKNIKLNVLSMESPSAALGVPVRARVIHSKNRQYHGLDITCMSIVPRKSTPIDLMRILTQIQTSNYEPMPMGILVKW